MAFRMGVSRAPDEDDEDDDVADLFDEEFLEHMEALKQACQMLPGAEVRLKTTSTLAASKFEEEGYEEEGDGEDDDDDDALLLSIERKFLGKGGLVSGPARTKAAAPAKERVNPRSADKDDGRAVVAKSGAIKGAIARHSLAPHAGETVQPLRHSASAHADSSDDEDGDLLRSVKECCGALDLVKASKNVKTSVLKDTSFSNGDVDPGFSAEGRGLAFLDAVAVPARDDEDANSFSEEDRVSFPNVEDGSSEDVQAKSSFEDVGRSPANVDAVNGLQSFLPAQLSDEEFGDNPQPLAVYDPGLISHGAKAKVPENVQAVTEALLKNRLCQQTLRELLRQLELKLHENKEMQRRAVSLVEYQKACTRKFCGFTEVVNRSVELIATKPVSKKKTGEFKVKGPPENPDVKVFRQLQSQLPAEFNVRKWTKKETLALAKGVRQQLQEIRVRAMMEGWDSDDEGRDFDEQMGSIGESEEELKKGLPSVDWNEVARIYVSGRSPWECKLQWENNEDPLLNNKSWTKAEDKKLLSIVQAHDMVEWAAIAVELGTHRTPAQCAIRFQRSLNASILRSAWTPDEDEQLQAAVERFGEKDWQSVAACVEGRLGSQCMSRWTKVLHPNRHRRGRWLPEEDTRLKWAVSVYGPRGWKNIATHVPGRSDVQCRERWCNVLDPSVKIDDWSAEEDAKLEELVVKYGRHRWAAVGAELGRTDNQCFRHWKLLHPEHKISFKKDMDIRRAALATNFVGREKERPELGLQDFLPPPGVGEEDCSRPLLLKSSKPVKRAPRKRKTPELPSEVNENLPLEKEVASADGSNEVPLNSSNGSRRRLASQPGERVTKKRNLRVLASADESVQIEEDAQIFEVASSNGDHEGPVNSLQDSRRKQAPNRVAKAPRAPKKTNTPELTSEVLENLSNEKEVQNFEVASADGSNEVTNSSNGPRKRRVSQPGERASKKRKAPELPSVVIESRGDIAKESRDDKDAELIVYTRRKSRVFNSGKSSLDNSGTSGLTTVGIEMSTVAQGERGDGMLAASRVLSKEPTLKRQRKGLMLPNFLYRDSLDGI